MFYLAGNDKLGGDEGADQMTGGLGGDRYQVNDPGDLMIEAPGEGRDVVEVESLASYPLSEHFGDLKLTDFGAVPVLTGVGNDADNELHGNRYDNLLDGGQGNDRLWGGLGTDELRGGSGNDTYSFEAFGGTATIRDVSSPGEGNRLQFGATIRPGKLAFRQNAGSLEIMVTLSEGLTRLWVGFRSGLPASLLRRSAQIAMMC